MATSASMVRRERVGAPVDRRCPFEKAILSATCECEQAGRYSEAEHLGVSCQSSLAWLNCRTLLELIREHSRFALKVTDTSAALPFGKDMKVMIGGLLGLQRAMAGDESRVSNIYALVVAAQEHFGGLEALPFQEIVKSVTAFELRKRRAPPEV